MANVNVQTAERAAPLDGKGNGKVIQSNNPPKTLATIEAGFKAAEKQARAIGSREGTGKLARLDFAMFIGESAAQKPQPFPATRIGELLQAFTSAASMKATGKEGKLGEASLTNMTSTFKSFYVLGEKPFGLEMLALVNKVARMANGPLNRAYKCTVALNKRNKVLTLEELQSIASATETRTTKAKLIAMADATDKTVTAQRKAIEDEAEHAWPKAAVDAAETYAKALRAAAAKL
jgi:hypothetical protein